MSRFAGRNISSAISTENPNKLYKIICEIGSGTYGKVYEGRTVANNDRVAIKVLNLEQSGDDFQVVQEEINLMKRLLHKNIVQYFNSYLIRDKLWIVMEYCSGGSLQDIYHASGSLNEIQIAFVCRETLEGLRYLHHLNIMHRDIKGANILLTDDGDIKLADFGVSAQLTATLGKRKSFIGSPYWMAPEVALTEKKGGYNQQCDIWAVGITAIELAERQPPNFHMQPMQCLYYMTKSSFKPPKLKDPTKWSPDFHQFIKIVLNKHPAKRPTASQCLNVSSFLLQPHLKRSVMYSLLQPKKRFADDIDVDEEDIDIKNMRRLQSKQKDEKKPTDSAAVSRFIRPDSANKATDGWVNSSDSDDDFARSESRSSENIASNSSQNQFDVTDKQTALRSEDHGQATLKYYTSNSAHNRNESNEATLQKNDHPGLAMKGDDRYNVANNSNDDNNAATLTKQSQALPSDSRKYGLPHTPKVLMGACFSKIFDGCPLQLNCATTWIHPITSVEHIIFGAQEGIYSLDVNEAIENDGGMDPIFAHRCTWLYVHEHILLSISGKNSMYLYTHQLLDLHEDIQGTTLRKSLSNAMLEKVLPRMFSKSQKKPETKGCLRCCVAKDPYCHKVYLCAQMQQKFILYQWYEPTQKFININSIESTLSEPLATMEMFLTGRDGPQICYGVRRTRDPNTFRFDVIDFTSRFDPPNHDLGDFVDVQQLEKDVILICFERQLKIVNLKGRLKVIKKLVPEMDFDFRVNNIVCLYDSVLMFHDHGMQGKSFYNNEQTQYIVDKSKTFRLLGSNKLIVLESKHCNHNSTSSNIYVVAGHESTS